MQSFSFQIGSDGIRPHQNRINVSGFNIISYESVPLITLPIPIFGLRWITRAHRALPKYGGHFSGTKHSLERHSQTCGASKKYGTNFLKKTKRKNSLDSMSNVVRRAGLSEKYSLEQHSQTCGAIRNSQIKAYRWTKSQNNFHEPLWWITLIP